MNEMAKHASAATKKTDVKKVAFEASAPICPLFRKKLPIIVFIPRLVLITAFYSTWFST
jgi:hypothetical protein